MTNCNEQAIGGHVGMTVYRSGSGTITKRAEAKFPDRYEENLAALHREYDMLKAMSGSGFTPEPIFKGNEFITQSDVGDTEPVTDAEAFRRNCIKALYELRQHNIRHGDLTGVNVIIRDNWPWLIDFQEAHFIGEPAPQKQPYSDSYLMCRTIQGTPGPDGLLDTPRVARRWLAVLSDLGAIPDLGLPLTGRKFLDLGCFQGDFTAAAAAEGMVALGVDQGGFRTGENSIAIARKHWEGLSCQFLQADVFDLPNHILESDVTVAFSMWPYLVQQRGAPEAIRWLELVMDHAGVFYFETQLHGDGPGVDFHGTDDQVYEMLGRSGRDVLKLVTIPVTGRPASRTVWSVR